MSFVRKGLPPSGSPGDIVVMSGQGFSNAFSVGFGNTSVPTMTIDSDTQITVSVPNGSGKVPVIVITPAGRSDPSPNAEFAYT